MMYQPSQKKEQIKIGECEMCEAEMTKVTLHYGNSWFCDKCWTLESAAVNSNLTSAPPSVVSLPSIRVNSIQSLESIPELRTDLFNSNTLAIVERKNQIDSDETIENKPYALAENLKNWHTEVQARIFELEKQKIEAVNTQRAIQVYLNNLANQLRADERETLKIKDINYTPKAPKSGVIKQITTRTTPNAKTKIDKRELRIKANEMGISEFTLYNTCIAHNVSVVDGALILQKSIEAARNKS